MRKSNPRENAIIEEEILAKSSIVKAAASTRRKIEGLSLKVFIFVEFLTLESIIFSSILGTKKFMAINELNIYFRLEKITYLIYKGY